MISHFSSTTLSCDSWTYLYTCNNGMIFESFVKNSFLSFQLSCQNIQWEYFMDVNLLQLGRYHENLVDDQYPSLSLPGCRLQIEARQKVLSPKKVNGSRNCCDPFSWRNVGFYCIQLRKNIRSYGGFLSRLDTYEGITHSDAPHTTSSHEKAEWSRFLYQAVVNRMSFLTFLMTSISIHSVSHFRLPEHVVLLPWRSMYQWEQSKVNLLSHH